MAQFSVVCEEQVGLGTVIMKSGVLLFFMSHTHQTVGKIQEGGVGHSQQAVRRMSRLAEVHKFAYTNEIWIRVLFVHFLVNLVV